MASPASNEVPNWLERRQERKRAEGATAHAQAAWAVVESARNLYERAKLDQVDPSPPIITKRGEEVYFKIAGAQYLEPRRQPGHYTGRSSGWSFPVVKGVRYRVGASRGTYVPGPEEVTSTDVGTFVITSQRCVFVGSRRTTEWAYSKLIGMSLDYTDGVLISVSNRQKPSGVLYGGGLDDVVDCLLTAAIAKFQGSEEHARVVEDLRLAWQEAYDRWASADAHRAQLAGGQAPQLPPAP
jgi:hypothetical protein